MSEEIKREFVFGVYARSKTNKGDDLLIVKEKLHKGDKVKNNLRFIKNYQRPFYITKPEYRTHKDKKEYEHLHKTTEHYSNQTQLSKSIFYALNGYHYNGYLPLSKVNESPYVYGTDISTPTLLANEYKTRYPNVKSPNSVAIMDFETDVINNTGDIISGVLSFKSNVFISVTKTFLNLHKINNEVKTILETINKRITNNPQLKTLLEKRNLNFTVSIVESPANVVIDLFNHAHKLQFDFLGFWNIKFDIGKCIKMLEKENIDPAVVFSDPSVPKEFKFYNWQIDQLVKRKANGEDVSKNPIDLWHTLSIPASFYPICLMACYRLIRARDALEVNYKLDTILKKELDVGKLYFDDIAKDLTELDWHKYMQANHKYDYLTYMVWDAISVELLDEKTKDISHSIKSFIGISEFSNIKSNPKRLCNDLYFELLKTNKVLCGVGSGMSTEQDNSLPSLKGWIVALSSELTDDIGVKILSEYENLATNISLHCFDLDVSSAYPNIEIALNISKSTRRYEVCKINGLTELEFRELGINLTNVSGNALSLAKKIYPQYPSLSELLDKFTNI